MSIGPWQIALILLIILIVFGAGKLPSVMSELARGMRSFKSGLKGEDKDTDGEGEDSEKLIDNK